MRNYSIYTLKTKLEFTNLYQYLSEKDYKQLEQQILCHSYHTPICTWNGIVINGIEAYELFRKHSIPFRIKRLHFSSKEDVISWICTDQLKREDLTNINKKYLNRQIKVSPKAKPSRLWGGIKVNQHRIPIIAFNPKQSGSHISVAIRKGKTTMIRHAFIATMTSGHEGVFARGEYQGKNFVRGKFPPKRKNTKGWLITELLTTSSFRMSLAPDIRPKVSRFIGNEVTARIHEKLTSRVNKIAAKNG